MRSTYFLVAAGVLAAAGASQKDECLAAWAKIREKSPTYVNTTHEGNYPQLEAQDHDRFEFKRHGQSMCFVEHRDSTYHGKTKSEESCWVVNEYYAFVLGRTAPESGWMLRQLALSHTEDYRSLVKRLHLHQAFAGFRGIIVADALLSEIVANAECEFVDAVDDPQRCKLVFRRSGAQPFTTEFGLRFRPQRGTVVLNKANGWIVESAVLVRADGKEETVVCHYTGEPRIIPSEIVRTTHAGTETQRVLEAGFDDRFSESDFRLKAFGLPEPSGVPSSAPKKLWYVGIASVLLVFAGIWLMRRRR